MDQQSTVDVYWSIEAKREPSVEVPPFTHGNGGVSSDWKKIKDTSRNELLPKVVSAHP